MKKILWILIIPLLAYSTIEAQTVSLQQCRDSARANYPLIKQNAVFAEIVQKKVASLRTNYLPTITLTGQATYQSDAIELSIPPPIDVNIKQPHDQYKAVLEIQQLIWDGGATKTMSALERSSTAIQQQQTEVQLYQINEAVNEVFFMGLSLQIQSEIMRSVSDDLNSKMKIVESGVKNGVLLPVQLDLLKAEVIKLDQKQMELEMGRQAALSVLSELAGFEIDDASNLEFPNVSTATSNTQQRPEYLLISMQKMHLETSQKLSSVSRMPKIGAFAQAGYGRPGMNMLSDEFSPFYIVGAQISWQLWDWNRSSRTREILSMQSSLLNIQQEVLDKNLKIASQKETDKLIQLEKIIEKDNELVDLRKRILLTYDSQLKNGVITPNEYLTELNALAQAKLNAELHKIQLQQARVNYNTIQGQ